MKLDLAQTVCLILMVIMTAGAAYVTLEKRAYDEKILTLTNAAAEASKTVEVTQGLYTKATIESKNLQDLLNSKDSQITDLKAQLSKTNESLLSATNLMIKWKNDYLAVVAGTQTTLPSNPATPNAPERLKVAFSKDFGPILASGFCLTNPPEASVDLHQQRPLKLTLAISQDSTGIWHSYVTNSEAKSPSLVKT